jgi:SAM-dependent methyltransferase
MKRSKSLYRYLKDIWQLLPPVWNDWLRNKPGIGAVIRKVANTTVPRAQHQEIYDSRYYKYVDRTAAQSAPVMADTIISHFKPKTVIDVGCGTGALLAEIKRRGVTVHGLEYSDAGLALSRIKGLDVEKFDLQFGGLDSIKKIEANLTLSLEVAEHIPPALADHYIEAICSFSPLVIMTAATPGQGGLDHVNEQPHAYWIEKMNEKQFHHDKKLSAEIRKRWTENGVARWYANNVMVFRRAFR